MKVNTFLLPALSAALLTTTALGDAVKIEVGAKLERFPLLKSGTHRYVRYRIEGAKRKVIDIWERTLTFETQSGKPMMHIVQRWDEAEGGAVLIQDSWFETGTFLPTTHVRRTEVGEKITVGGYQFTPDRVVGMPNLPDNVRATFEKKLPQPSFNFEYDMEFLQALPLKENREFNIPFYDAGVDEPGRYVFKVAGHEIIKAPDGHDIDCWLVTADYNTGKIISRFWFSKKTQVLIREESSQNDSSRLVKALLPPER